MSIYLAYFLGILTVVIIIILFIVFARINENVADVYDTVFCQAANDDSADNTPGGVG